MIIYYMFKKKKTIYHRLINYATACDVGYVFDDTAVHVSLLRARISHGDIFNRACNQSTRDDLRHEFLRNVLITDSSDPVVVKSVDRKSLTAADATRRIDFPRDPKSTGTR